MSATLSKLRTSWVGRALLAYAVSALALVVLGLAAPGSAVFFPLVSLWCNLALFVLVLVSSARIAKVGRRQDALLQVRNLILFGLMSMVAMVILLWPLVSHILGYDYADH